jgi:hypothetical protein
MKILKTYIIAALSALALSSHAYIFFDDFDGDDLKPYWYIDKGEFYSGNWEYTVEDSMLNVWNVWGEGGIGIVDIETFTGTFPSQKNDFDLKARFGWDTGVYQSISLVGLTVSKGTTFYMGYHVRPNIDPLISINFVNWGGGQTTIQAPEAGMHEFRVQRIGTFMYAYVNNELVYSSNTQYYFQLGSVGFRMIGPSGYNNPDFAPLYVDWVAVVPEPASLACLSTFLAYLFTRRKK